MSRAIDPRGRHRCSRCAAHLTTSLITILTNCRPLRQDLRLYYSGPDTKGALKLVKGWVARKGLRRVSGRRLGKAPWTRKGSVDSERLRRLERVE